VDIEHSLSDFFHPEMADAPFAAVGITEQSSGREEEPAPAPHPQAGLVAVYLAQNAFDLVATGIEIGESVERGALVMRAAPAPFLFDLEQVCVLPDQMMARHHAARSCEIPLTPLGINRL
jgi:hypothetical protein